jgi:hypothetical protein
MLHFGGFGGTGPVVGFGRASAVVGCGRCGPVVDFDRSGPVVVLEGPGPISKLGFLIECFFKFGVGESIENAPHA